MIYFFLLLSLSVPALPEREDLEAGDSAEFRARLEKAGPKDSKGRLEVGIWCEEKGRLSWALQCYQQVLKLRPSAAYPEALFRVARMDLSEKRYEAGYAKLREITAAYQHAEARAILEKAENDATRKQQGLLKKAESSFLKKNYKEARGFFAQVYKLSPDKISDAPFAPRNDILRRLAACVDLLDDQYYSSSVQPIERSVQPCLRCRSNGGFEQCIQCNGTGEISRPTGLGGRIIVKVPCPRCGGYQWTFCETCRGLECTTPDSNLTLKERKALNDVVDKVRRFKVLDQPLSEALKEVENVLLEVNEGSTLNYFRALKPKYSLSQSLRTALRSVPPQPEAVKEIASTWKPLGRRAQANFLLGYACEFAQYVRHFDMLRTSLKKVDFRSSSAALKSGSEALGPELLSAFPDDEREGWVRVRGILSKYSEDPQDPYKGELKISGELPHNVRFFNWLPSARSHLERLEKGPWSKRISGLSQSYPFRIRDELLKTLPDHKVMLAGRFLRDRLGFPRNWFEVWDLEIGLSTTQEEILLAFKEPVVIRHPAMKVGEIARWVQMLYGLKLAFEGVDEKASIEVDARDCTLGLFLSELAKDRGTRFYYDKGIVRFSPAPPALAGKDIQAVLAELMKTDKGKVRFGKAQALTALPRAEGLPDDPALLEKRAAKAIASMDYAAARECHQKLLDKVRDASQKKKLSELASKFQLFHEITKSTGLSHLAGAKDLARIIIHSPSGDSRQTVRILERRPDILLVQPGYGGEFAVKASAVKKNEPLAPEDWRREKETELEERAGKLAKASPREQMSECFFLALFSKTNDFPGRGTAFLEKAILHDEFSWLIATYFPDQREELTDAWRKATGREAPELAQAEEEKEKSAPAEKTIAGVKPQEPLPGKVEELLPFARKHYDQGRLLVGKSLPGMDNAQGNLKVALDHLQLAQDALNKLSESRPSDLDAGKLRRDLAPLIEIAVRGLNFFE